MIEDVFPQLPNLVLYLVLSDISLVLPSGLLCRPREVVLRSISDPHKVLPRSRPIFVLKVFFS